MLEKEISFNEQEHTAGFHDTFTENCGICGSENERIQKFRQNELRMAGEQGENEKAEWEGTRYQELHRGDDPHFTRNPLE